MAPLAHAKLSASGAHRWLKCPGSVRLSQDVPYKTSVYAEEGTAAHQLAEWCLTQNVDAASKIGKTVSKSSITNKFITVSTEMAAAVQVYLDQVRAALKDLPGSKLVVEQKFALDWLMPGILWGTNDASVIQKYGKLVTFDLKFGAGVTVDAEENDQLRYYALGALGEKNLNCIEDMEITIVQPRGQGEKVKVWRTTPEETYAWANDVLLPGAKAALDDDAPLKSGDHCKWCPAKAFCPQIQKDAVAVFTAVNPRTPVDPEAVPPKNKLVLPAGRLIETERLEQIVAIADLVSDWLDSCRDELKGRLERGCHSDQYKLVAGRATRSWTDEVLAAEKLRYLGIDPLSEPELISVAEAEKRLKAANSKVNIDETELVHVSRGVSLVPIKDKRPALAAGVRAFTAIEEAK